MSNYIIATMALVKKHIPVISQWLLLIFLLENCGNLSDSTQPRPEEKVPIEKAQAFIQVAAKNSEGARGQGIVFVLGNTGAGKSTVISYLLGNKMKKIKANNRKFIVEPENPTTDLPSIGHTHKSHTFFPNVYASPSSPIIYCDCPGFEDNRMDEERFNTTIATQMMVNEAKSIQGIIVVIDTQELDTLKGKAIRQISSTLNQLLKGNPNPSSILFIFNEKTSAKINYQEDIHPTIEEIKKEELEKLAQLESTNKSTNNVDNKEYEKIAQVVSILSIIENNHKEKSFIIDILDNFESKNQIEKLLQNIVATPKEGFNFSDYDETRVQFEKQLNEITGNITSKLIEFVQASEGINTNTELLASCQSRITAYQKQLQQLEATVLANSSNIEEKIKELEEQVTKHKHKIKELEIEKQEIQDKITTLTAQKINLDTDESDVLHWEDSGTTRFTGMDDRKEGGWWIFGGSIIYTARFQTKYFRYSGVPFARVSKIIEHGKLEDEVINKEKGIYQGTLVSTDDWMRTTYKDGYAKVSIYIKKRDTPAHKKQIQQIEQEIQEEQKTINKHDQEMQALHQTCGSIQQMIVFHKNDAKNQKAEKTNRMKEVKEQIERAEREKKDLEAISILLSKKLYETQAYIEHQESLINAISSLVAQGICKESSLFTSFKEHYKLYQDLQKGLLPEVDFPGYLECPITLGIFDDPVVTKCGHTFSSAPLLAHLATQKFCPTCKKSVAFEDLIPNITVREQVEAFRFKKAAEAKKKLEKIEKS